MNLPSPSGPGALRLVFPQWQGAAGAPVRQPAPDGLNDVQRSYHLGPPLLQLLSPVHDGPTASVPVSTGTADEELATDQGIYARAAVLHQLRGALRVLQDAGPESVVVFGGDCSVSVAPFSYLEHRYGPDLAVLWIDAHSDTSLPGGSYTGFRAMALATLAGRGDAEFVSLLPARVPPERILQVGLRHWDGEGIALKEELGIRAVGITDTPDDVRRVLEWIRQAGASRFAVHIDLDVLARRDFTGSTTEDDGGMRVAELVGLVEAVAGAGEIVGLTLSHHAPRELMRLGALVDGLPV